MLKANRKSIIGIVVTCAIVLVTVIAIHFMCVSCMERIDRMPMPEIGDTIVFYDTSHNICGGVVVGQCDGREPEDVSFFIEDKSDILDCDEVPLSDIIYVRQ